MKTLLKIYTLIVLIYNTIILINYMREKMRAKNEKQKNIFKNGDNTNIAFFPDMPYIDSNDPKAQIARKPHFADKWFTRSDLTIRLKVKP